MDRWEYLVTKDYLVRHHIAEYFVRDSDAVVEIGTYKRKLNINKPLYSIDPLKTIEDSFHGTIYDWFNTNSNILENVDYAVVALGLDIEGSDLEMQSAINLIKNSKVSVIEFAINHQNSCQQFDIILENCGKKVSHKMEMRFPDVNTDGFPPFPNRNLFVLKG